MKTGAGRASVACVAVWMLGASACSEAGAEVAGAPAPAPPPETGATPRWERTWSIATHNSYWVNRGAKGDAFASGVGERLLDQLLYDRARGLELDVHRDDDRPGRFRVYHTAPGNSLCDDLDDCLAAVRLFHATLPRHEPLAIVVELKEIAGPSFDETHPIASLDDTLRGALGPLLFTPRELLARCDAAGFSGPPASCWASSRWPTLDELRGRVIVAVLGNWDAVGGQGTADWAAYATRLDLRDMAAFPMASSWKLDWSKMTSLEQARVTQEGLDRALANSPLLQVEDTADPRLAPFLASGGVVRIDGANAEADQETRALLGAQLLQTDTPWVQWSDPGATQALRALDPGFDPERLREPGGRLLAFDPELHGEILATVPLAPGRAARWESTIVSGASADGYGCLVADGPSDRVAVCRWKAARDRVGSPDAESAVVMVERTGAQPDETIVPVEERAGEVVGERVALEVDAAGACVRAWASGDATTDGAPYWRELGPPRCAAAGFRRAGLFRPSTGAPAPAPVLFAGTRRDGAPVRARDLAVEARSEAGASVPAPAQALVDATVDE